MTISPEVFAVEPQQPTKPATTSLAEAFAVEAQATTTTGTTSLADAFANTTKTETTDTKYEIFKDSITKEMGDLSSDQYAEKLKLYINTNNDLIQMGLNSRYGTELDIDKFSQENKFMQRMLDEINAEKPITTENAEVIKVSQIQGELMSMPDLNNQMQSNFEMIDSTSTQPIPPSFDFATQNTLQATATAPTSLITKIADFTSNLLPDFSLLDLFADADTPTTSNNIELSGLDTISVKGHNVFVEEIAKIVNNDTPTTDSEKTEDSAKVVKKLDELILLMRRGGISVNMDGRKVSRAVSSATDQ